MNLASPSQVRALLQELGVRPSQALGQNFLIDRNILNILVQTAEIDPDSRVLEVGPGLGIVTRALLEGGAHVRSVERDRRLFAHLQDTFESEPNLDLVCGNVLDFPVEDLLDEYGDALVSNLPYSVGNRVLMNVFAMNCPPSRIVVTVQWETAQRLAAVAGTRDYGLLSVWAGVWYEIEVVKKVTPTCFWPRPDVLSAIVRMRRRARASIDGEIRSVLFDLTRYAFKYRRKKLSTALVRADSAEAFAMGRDDCEHLLQEIGVPGDARAESLTVDQWCRFARAVVARQA